MLKRLGLVVVLLSPTWVFAQAVKEIPSPPVPMGSLAYLDARNGFRAAQFGAPRSSFTGLELVEKGEVIFYQRKNENLQIGEGQAKAITYGFYQDRLLVINIETVGMSNSQAVLLVFQQAYGPGAQDNKYLQQYHWLGQKVFVTYKENSATHNALISLLSVPLQHEIAAEQNEKAKKATGGS
jgi:hypothetical protein